MSQPNSFDENVTLPLKWNKLEFFDLMIIETQMTLLTQQFIGNQQIQTFTLTGIHIHHYSGRKRQPTC